MPPTPPAAAWKKGVTGTSAGDCGRKGAAGSAGGGADADADADDPVNDGVGDGADGDPDDDIPKKEKGEKKS